MTSRDFEEYIKKEYVFDKIFDYFLATFWTVGGILMFYKTALTNWSKNLGVGLFIYSLIFCLYVIYFGIVGFLRIPRVPEIHFIPNKKGQKDSERKIFELKEKLNLSEFPSEEKGSILNFRTKKMLRPNKEIYFYIDDKGIYFNVQHINSRDPKYNYFPSTKKLINKIKTELLLN